MLLRVRWSPLVPSAISSSICARIYSDAARWYDVCLYPGHFCDSFGCWTKQSSNIDLFRSLTIHYIMCPTWADKLIKHYFVIGCVFAPWLWDDNRTQRKNHVGICQINKSSASILGATIDFYYSHLLHSIIYTHVSIIGSTPYCGCV